MEKPEVNAMGGAKNIEVIMNTPKVLTPNEVFRVDTILENHGFVRKNLKTFLMLGDEIQEQELAIDAGYQGKITWTLKAPSKPGSNKLYFFSSSGDLIEEDLTVISKRNVKIQRVSLRLRGSRSVLHAFLRALPSSASAAQRRLKSLKRSTG